jgi:hypothetical protein
MNPERNRCLWEGVATPYSSVEYVTGGVGEWLKPAVLKNQIVDSLSDRKFT